MKALALEQRATGFAVFLAAFACCLKQHTGQHDLAIGTPAANRNHKSESLIGFFVNQLVMRVSLAGCATFRDAVASAREVVVDAYSHQALPFDEIVAAARTGDTDPNLPFARVQLDMHTAPFGPFTIGALRLAVRSVARQSVQFDLQLSIEEVAEGFSCFLGYDAERFGEAFIVRFIDDLTHVVTLGAGAPGTSLDELLARPRARAEHHEGAEDFSFDS